MSIIESAPGQLGTQGRDIPSLRGEVVLRATRRNRLAMGERLASSTSSNRTDVSELAKELERTAHYLRGETEDPSITAVLSQHTRLSIGEVAVLCSLDRDEATATLDTLVGAGVVRIDTRETAATYSIPPVGALEVK